MTSPLFFGALGLGALGGMLLAAALVALFRLRPIRFALRLLAGLALLALAGFAATIVVGMQGYRALTREEVAAYLSVRPLAAQRFAATIRLPQGGQATYELAGDEIYADAHILKWKPIANLLGLHTVYELDRVAGRYRDVEQERSAPRTVYALRQKRPVDLFGLRQRHAFLEPLFDAEYGSASFVPVSGPAELELRVSTTGLLIRKAAP